MGEGQEQKARSGAWVVVVLLFLLVGYPASIGPVEWLLESGYLPTRSEPALEAFYFPVIIAYENVPAVERVLDWYVDLWDF